ncbi:MAG: hypothetical protein JWO19_4025 [Bryobacterales bacterium]|nr:hypothetical protein [Bryobacterales bacterium]
MKRRGVAIVAGLAAVLVTAASVSMGTAATESPRQTAWKLAEAVIKESSPNRGIPGFLNWAIPREIFPCRIQPNGKSDPAAPRDLFDESFHYNPEAAARLCGPLTRGPGAPPLDRALNYWAGSHPRASMIEPPFPDGAHLAAAFWSTVRRPTDPHMGKFVELPVRSGAQTLSRRIRITIPPQMSSPSSSCGPPNGQGEPAMAGVTDVSINDFFWIKLKPGERYSGASCGDFAVLVAFHLVHKVQGRWLWTTFWWDSEPNEFAAGRPGNFIGAGENPQAWRKYVMDATYEPTGAVFNPWRIEERGDNCARCHKEVTSYKDDTTGEQIFFDSVTAARTHFN